MNSWFRIGTNMHAPTPTPNPSLHAISFFSPPKNCENQFGQWGSSPPNVGNAQKKGCFVLGDLILPWSVQFHKWRRTPRRESGTSTWKPGPPRRCRRAMAGSLGCSKGRRWRGRGRWGRLGWASSRPGNDPSHSRWQCPEQSWPVQAHSWQKKVIWPCWSVVSVSCCFGLWENRYISLEYTCGYYWSPKWSPQWRTRGSKYMWRDKWTYMTCNVAQVQMHVVTNEGKNRKSPLQPKSELGQSITDRDIYHRTDICDQLVKIYLTTQIRAEKYNFQMNY